MKLTTFSAVLGAAVFALILVPAWQIRAAEQLAAPGKPALECSGDPDWLQKPDEPPKSVAAPADPEDCFFYRAAWKHFLYATRSDRDGKPAFIGFPNIATIFGASTASKMFIDMQPNRLGLAARDVERPNELPADPSRLTSIGEGVRQAGGLFGLVIDAAGHPVYYSIHVNQIFAEFISENGLVSKLAVESQPGLEFKAGVAEYKAAWMIAPSNAARDPNFIYAEADVPSLIQDASGVLRTDPDRQHVRPVLLRLIAFHVAFVIEDHPEFIWATFEHVDLSGKPDLAPSAETADSTSSVKLDPSVAYLLFAAGAGRDSSNSPCPGKAPKPCDPTKEHPIFDAASQTFSSASGSQQTSVFREFPASKSDGSVDQDRSVLDINVSMRELLAPVAGPRDERANYRLVGATWLEHPRTGGGRAGDFVLNGDFFNPDGQDLEDRSRIVAGEDSLSSTAMESFTQRDFPSCFACHTTGAVHSDEPGRPLILKPTLLNVSHVISRFLSNPN